MGRSLVRRAFAPVVELRDEESVTALLMFCYSFLVMTGYNLAKPVTYSKFIDCLLYTSPSPRDRQKSRMPSSA